MIPNRARLQGESTFFPFVYILNAAHNSRDSAKEKSEGSNLHRVSSALFCAFAVEAYLNHLGEEALPYWDIVEPKMSWQSKLDLLARHFQATTDFGARPFQTIKQLFKFRDKLAHGKTETWEFEHEFDPANDNAHDPKWLSEYWTDAAVDRAIEDTEAVIEFLHEKAGFDPMDLHRMGSSFAAVKLPGGLKAEDIRGITRPQQNDARPDAPPHSE